MVSDFDDPDSRQVPWFYYHLGDVVYSFGERKYYYDQFYDPYRTYPAPIFAIQGNHDALTYDASQAPLSSFISAFCAATPGIWDGFGGVRAQGLRRREVHRLRLRSAA